MTLREDEFKKLMPIQIGRGYITSDGQYWIESNKSNDSVKTGNWNWFDPVDRPKKHWAEKWNELITIQVMES